MNYKFKRVEENGYIITEEGHTMFPEDVIVRLNEIKYLKNKLKEALQKELKI